MKREQTVALVKEIVANQLICASWLSIDKREKDGYQLTFKGEYNHQNLDAFLLKHNLSEEENTEKGLVVIFKP